MKPVDFQNKHLTSIEKELITKIAIGFTIKQIAALQGKSEYTLIAQKRNIYLKLGIRKIVHLGVFAERFGYLSHQKLKI